ncbi:MAG: hypothetical protein QGF53_07395 [Alphaproteobacteria bacterium]|jgi:hypothetical protein|nr:hypothetical protein [Alphaproteobacteria bacterium]
MEMLAFTLVAIALYLGADAILRTIERRLGRRLEQRSLAFFAILLPSAVLSFAAIQAWLGPPPS